ncbi:MAG: hypothetical protein E7774_11615 [Bradyrhizobium sp.]|nr:MAG: hypothetical protein E7774_11615 [Bradyrhizobium sp.]
MSNDDHPIPEQPVVRLTPQPRRTMTREDDRPLIDVGALGRRGRESREKVVRLRCRDWGLSSNGKYKRLKEICDSVELYSKAWDSLRLQERILELADSVRIQDPQREEIARCASNLLEALKGWRIPDENFDGILEDLANRTRTRSGRGGDHRSGRRTWKSDVHSRIVDLYLNARAGAGFSVDGPMERFVAAVCELLGIEGKTREATRAECYRLKRRQGARGPNEPDDDAPEGKGSGQINL